MTYYPNYPDLIDNNLHKVPLSMFTEDKKFVCEVIKDFFPVSDDQCGGVYCFKKNNGKFEDKIYYLDLSNLEVIVEETEFNFIQIFMKLAFNK